MDILELLDIELTLQILVFVVASMSFAVLIGWLYSGLSGAHKHLDDVVHRHHPGDIEHESGFSIKWIEPIANLVLPPDNWRRSHLKSRLVMAGFSSPKAQAIFLVSKLVCAIMPPLLVMLPLIVFGYVGSNQSQALLLFFATLAFGFFLPDVYLFHKREQRQQVLAESFPDALDLLVVCVEAGLSLDAAIQRVAREIRISHPELSDEMAMVSLELRAGKSRNEALTGLADRSGLSDIRSLTSILIQAENFGTSVADALREHAEEMRGIRLQRAREKAAKLPVKMTFPILLFIFPAIFLVILGPAIIRIFTALLT